jgi:hypothetical protein
VLRYSITRYHPCVWRHPWKGFDSSSLTTSQGGETRRYGRMRMLCGLPGVSVRHKAYTLIWLAWRAYGSLRESRPGVLEDLMCDATPVLWRLHDSPGRAESFWDHLRSRDARAPVPLIGRVGGRPCGQLRPCFYYKSEAIMCE